jgi:hypothetical protein
MKVQFMLNFVLVCKDEVVRARNERRKVMVGVRVEAALVVLIVVPAGKEHVGLGRITLFGNLFLGRFKNFGI